MVDEISFFGKMFRRPKKVIRQIDGKRVIILRTIRNASSAKPPDKALFDPCFPKYTTSHNVCYVKWNIGKPVFV